VDGARRGRRRLDRLGQDSAGLPFLGWNTEHGDLRVAPFVGVHALQVLLLPPFALTGLLGHRLHAGPRLHVVVLGAAAGLLQAVTVPVHERSPRRRRSDSPVLDATRATAGTDR